jgi:precorrin-6B methylase 2
MSFTIRHAVESTKRGDLIDASKFLFYGLYEKSFERWYGIRSAGRMSSRELGTDAAVSNDYQPTRYHILHDVFRKIAPRQLDEEQVLLDVGCGKGRVVTVAATYPYSAVIGVEISDQLVSCAQENLVKARHHFRCPNVKVLPADVTRMEIPEEVTTVFIYNAFRGAPLNSFMENLHASLLRRERVLTVAFVNPEGFDASQYPWLRRTETMRRFPSHHPSAVVAFFTAGDVPFQVKHRNEPLEKAKLEARRRAGARG